MLRISPTTIVASIVARSLRQPKILGGLLLLALGALLVACGSKSSSSVTEPPPNITGSWEFLALSSNGAVTGIEIQLIEGQQLVNGLEVPSGQISADSAQMNFVSLVPSASQSANQTFDISGYGGTCGAAPTTSNGLSGTISALGSPINFTLTANGSVFNVTGTLTDAQTVLNGTYTPQAGNTCTDPGGTISGVAVSVHAGQYVGEICSPSEISCSSPDDNVTATVSSKSGQVTLSLALTGADNTSFTVAGPQMGNSVTVQGTFQGESVTYYGYFEVVYDASSATNLASLYLANATDPCFANPGATCSTATILQIPQIP